MEPVADAVISAGSARRSLVADYWELTKPRITLLVLVTTLGAMIWAASGLPRVELLLATIAGMALASGGAAALNHVLDRDLDRMMERTRYRPVADERVSPRSAAIFGLGLNALAALILATWTNPLTVLLALGGSFFYVVIYTMALKRRTVQNIVIGGAAGAIPPLAGWAAVTGRIGLAPVIMFLIIFLWTPPHFWSLAILKRNEYAAAGIPMLPSVRSERETTTQILVYTALLVAATLIPVAAGLLGLVYLTAAVVLGARFLQLAVRLARTYAPRAARDTFLFSLAYLALIFGAMALDRIVAAL
jgi:heme o synthase